MDRILNALKHASEKASDIKQMQHVVKVADLLVSRAKVDSEDIILAAILMFTDNCECSSNVESTINEIRPFLNSENIPNSRLSVDAKLVLMAHMISKFEDGKMQKDQLETLTQPVKGHSKRLDELTEQNKYV